MKPFIKPRPATPAKAPEPPAPRISPNELTIFGMASTLNDPAERQAYLGRACGIDTELRGRIEARLASRGPALPPAQQVPAELVKMQGNALATTNAGGERHDAVALVPMSAMQLANSQGPPRHSPVPWAVATMLAIAVGALGVFFLNEKKSREKAEHEASTAGVGKAEAEREKASAQMAALEAKTIAERTRTEADRQKAESEAATKRAEADAAASKTEREQALAAAKAAVAKEQAAQTEAANLRQTTAETQRTGALTLADSLAKLASLQSGTRGTYADAEANARQCLDLRTKANVAGWPMIEAQSILGTVLLRRDQDEEAKAIMLGVSEAMEKLPAPKDEPDLARLKAAKSRVVEYYNGTRQKKVGVAWGKRMDELVKTP